MDTSPQDVFYWKGISILQDERVLKVGTDALLLGTWVSAFNLNPKRILDIGTGSGILSLFMAKAFPQAEIMAIDPDPNAVDLARRNAQQAEWQDRIHIQNEELISIASQIQDRFDLIVSNPPFYSHHILPTQMHMQSAKHLKSMPKDWIKAIAGVLDSEGNVFVVVPFASAFEWIREANAHQLYSHSRLDVFSFPQDIHPKRSLLGFGMNLRRPQNARITIYARDQVYTEDYKTWMGL